MVNMSGKLAKRMAVIVGVVGLMSIAAPAAMAQSSSQRGYDGESPLGQIDDIAGQQQAGQGSPVADEVVNQSAGNEAGALPFTGTDLGIVLVLGLALAGTGLVVRRAARSTGN